jgi:hypothetical protein
MTKESLKMLQEESRNYQRTLYGTLAASILLLYPINRLLPLRGFQGKVVMTGVSIAAVCLPAWWMNNSCREKMVALKQRIFTENRPNFRKYELTGDILIANPDVRLVEG